MNVDLEWLLQFFDRRDFYRHGVGDDAEDRLVAAINARIAEEREEQREACAIEVGAIGAYVEEEHAKLAQQFCRGAKLNAEPLWERIAKLEDENSKLRARHAQDALEHRLKRDALVAALQLACAEEEASADEYEGRYEERPQSRWLMNARQVLKKAGVE